MNFLKLKILTIFYYINLNIECFIIICVPRGSYPLSVFPKSLAVEKTKADLELSWNGGHFFFLLNQKNCESYRDCPVAKGYIKDFLEIFKKTSLLKQATIFKKLENLDLEKKHTLIARYNFLPNHPAFYHFGEIKNFKDIISFLNSMI